MTKEEFKAKFKVGDIIKKDGSESTYKITAISEQHVVLIRNGYENLCDFDAYDWEKVEPKKKPSEEIRDRMISLGYDGNDLMDVKSLALGFNLILEKLDENWEKK
jgi:hypothetical protein